MRVVVVALLLFAGVRAAEASCGSARTALSPPSGARLPPHPTIYLFDTDHVTNLRDALSITGVDDELRFRATKLATTSDFTVHRIEVWSASPRDRAITVKLHGALLGTYEIADEQVVDHARVVDVRHSRHTWTCSYINTIEVEVEGNAIAYQIDWEDDRTTVLADQRVMWSGEVEDHAVLEIGHPNCSSYNVDPDQLAQARSFELYALFADGKVMRLGSSIARLDEEGARLPIELLAGADARLPRSFHVAVTTSPHWVFACGGVGGLVGAVVAILIGRRRRRAAEAERLAPARVVT